MEIKSTIDCSDQKFLPLMFESYPEQFRLEAKKELNETKENIDKGLAILRECIKRENLNLSSDDYFLLLFLRQAKFDFKKAEAKLRRSEKFFKKFEDDLASSDVKKVMAAIDHDFVGLLPFRDRKGRAVLFGRASAWKKDSFDMKDAELAMTLLALFASTFTLSSVCGFNYLTDVKLDFYYDLLPMFDSYRRNVPRLNSTPFRVQRVDAINLNNFVHYLVTAVRPLLPSKIKDRMHLYGSNFEKLFKHYTPSMLPFELGGTMGPISCDSYKEKFVNFVMKFQSEMRQRTK